MVKFNVLALTTLATSVSGRIIGANVVSMHGARAPDKEFNLYCPNHVHPWEVVARGLTGVGMQQMHDLGTVMKEAFVPTDGKLGIHHKFVDDVLDPTQIVLHAADATHCQQSALAMGHGLFPEKCSPSGYKYNAPLPYDSTAHDDNVLECKNWQCKTKVGALVAEWEKSEGAKLLKEHRAIIEKVEKACGSDFMNAADNATAFKVIKVVHEGFQFAKEQGFDPAKDLDHDTLVAFDDLATNLSLASQFGTAEGVTAFAGDLPNRMLANYKGELAAGAAPPDEGNHLWSYHGAPAVVQAVASLFGIEFKHEEHAVPATTLFFEFHDLSEKPSWETTTVRTFTWQRCSIKNGNDACPRTQVALAKCKGSTSDMECPLPEFEKLYNEHVAKTGEWSKLCKK